MNLKVKGKNETSPLIGCFNNDGDYNLNIELETFAKNIKKEIISIIGFFISLLIR
jgi:hypothetical protein